MGIGVPFFGIVRLVVFEIEFVEEVANVFDVLDR